MADIPGIGEGASEGKWLGLRVRRHIERNALLLFMVPADSNDIAGEYQILLNELSSFNPELMDKQRVLAITKSDLLDDELKASIVRELPEIPYVFISSVTGEGIQELKDILWVELNNDDNRTVSITHRNLDLRHRVSEEDNLDLELPGEGDEEDDSENYAEYDWDE